MTAAHSDHAHHGDHGDHGEHAGGLVFPDAKYSLSHHPPAFYIKVWAVLVVLLGVSIIGPTFEIRTVTMLTAFGVALVKAYLVATRFMHLDSEKRFITYLLLTMLAFMFLFFAAVAPDVMKHDGQRWENAAAKAATKRGLEHKAAAHHEESEEAEGAPAGEEHGGGGHH